MDNTEWKYVVEFSCAAEQLKSFDRASILACNFHPEIPGDAIVVMEVIKEEIMDLPFKTYCDARCYAEECHGFMKIFKVTDTSSFVGPNKIDAIRAEYGV